MEDYKIWIIYAYQCEMTFTVRSEIAILCFRLRNVVICHREKKIIQFLMLVLRDEYPDYLLLTVRCG